MAKRARGLVGRMKSEPRGMGSRMAASHTLRVMIVTALVGWSAAILAPAGPALGQCPDGPTLTMFLDQTIEVFRVGDFDPSDSHYHPHVFTATMCNNLDEPREVVLWLVIASDAYGTLGRGKTTPFELAPGITTINNQDLTEARGNYELEEYNITPEAEELENLMLELGYLPEGTYCFSLSMRPAGDGPIDFLPIEYVDCLTVTNPFNLELLRPGAPFGGDLSLVLTSHPQFQWTSRASSWRVMIAEIEPGDGSGEDVMENVPVYEAELAAADVLSGGATGTISWSYPSAGEDLEPGESYCWQVTSFVETSGGTEEAVSEVFCFRRWNPSDLAGESVLEALSKIWPELLDQLGSQLETMTPTGTVLLDGRPVDLATLQDIIDDIAEGKLNIQEIRIE